MIILGRKAQISQFDVTKVKDIIAFGRCELLSNSVERIRGLDP